MCTDSSITDLVTRARNGDKQGWDALVERYAPLVWSICRRHQLTDAEASNVGGTVWLQMADQLDRRPSWLAGYRRRAGMPASPACRAPNAECGAAARCRNLP